jgi:hypothetical protein
MSGKIVACDDKRFKTLKDVWDIPRFKIEVYGKERKRKKKRQKKQKKLISSLLCSLRSTQHSCRPQVAADLLRPSGKEDFRVRGE